MLLGIIEVCKFLCKAVPVTMNLLYTFKKACLLNNEICAVKKEAEYDKITTM
jgi:hypothetical protein